MSTSDGGGYCDCGDAEAWRSFPSCELHTPSSSEGMTADEVLGCWNADLFVRSKTWYPTFWVDSLLFTKRKMVIQSGYLARSWVYVRVFCRDRYRIKVVFKRMIDTDVATVIIDVLLANTQRNLFLGPCLYASGSCCPCKGCHLQCVQVLRHKNGPTYFFNFAPPGMPLMW